MKHNPNTLIQAVANKLSIQLHEVYCYAIVLEKRASFVNARPERYDNMIDQMIKEHNHLKSIELRKTGIQYKSLTCHNGTYAERVWRIGFAPCVEDYHPLTAYDEYGTPTDDWTVELSVRWVDLKSGEPATSWMGITGS